MSSSKGSKQKAPDLSTRWSEYEWDDRGFWFSCRLNADGVEEIDYKPPTQPHSNERETPRTPGTDGFAIVGTPNDTSQIAEGYEASFRPNDVASHDTSFQNSQRSPPISPMFEQNPHYQHEREVEDVEEPAGDFYNPLTHTTSRPRYDRRGSQPSSYQGPFQPTHLQNPAGGGSYTNSSLLSSFNSLSVNETFNSGVSSSALPVQGSKHISPAPIADSHEPLDRRYRVIENNKQRTFWKEGRVFMMLWTEPARTLAFPHAETRDSIYLVRANIRSRDSGSHFSVTFGEHAYSEIRRFVVVSPGYGNNICVPIQTYGKQATLKPNLPDAHQHAIIYTGATVPDEKWYYAHDGTVVRENLIKTPVKVVSECKDKEGELDPTSRINYSKIYTVENFVRVLNIGLVHRNSLPTLRANSMVKRNDQPQPPAKHPPKVAPQGGSGGHSGGRKGSSSRDKPKDPNRRH